MSAARLAAPTRCLTCEGMGRVTVEFSGKLTTVRCPNCNGFGTVEEHDTGTCVRCVESRVGSFATELEGSR